MAGKARRLARGGPLAWCDKCNAAVRLPPTKASSAPPFALAPRCPRCLTPVGWTGPGSGVWSQGVRGQQSDLPIITFSVVILSSKCPSGVCYDLHLLNNKLKLRELR